MNNDTIRRQVAIANTKPDLPYGPRYWVDVDDIEWGEMWHGLECHPINRRELDPLNDAGWEYHGSDDRGHYMVHDEHPATDKMETVYIPHSNPKVRQGLISHAESEDE